MTVYEDRPVLDYKDSLTKQSACFLDNPRCAPLTSWSETDEDETKSDGPIKNRPGIPDP